MRDSPAAMPWNESVCCEECVEVAWVERSVCVCRMIAGPSDDPLRSSELEREGRIRQLWWVKS